MVSMESTTLPAADKPRVELLYHFCRMQLPAVQLLPSVCEQHLHRTYALYAGKTPDANWGYYLDNLYPLDWFVTAACLEGNGTAWEYLFAARAGRSDCLLMDALRARAVRLYPRNEERQESAVTEFWGNLYAPPDRPGSLPVLARYDGLRPLVPWLIRVFQNWHISELRKDSGAHSLPEEDLVPRPPQQTDDRWHEVFLHAAHEWMDTLQEKELIILGLRLRYQMSQRDVANVLGIHEGTISRRTDALSDEWKKSISQKMIDQGWEGDDLSEYVRTEMRNLLLDDPRLSGDHLARMLAEQGKSLPVA
jgi:Trp operon repressor